MSILKLPIQINRGESVPTTLKEGELYYCTANNGLYVGTAEGSEILLNETTVNKNVDGYAFGKAKDKNGNDTAEASLKDAAIQGLQGLTIGDNMLLSTLSGLTNIVNPPHGTVVFVSQSYIQEANVQEVTVEETTSTSDDGQGEST